jgi:hypothetical protein
MQLAINTLFRRIPTLQLATPLHTISFDEQKSVYSMDQLPVTWDPSTKRTTPDQTTD